MPTDHRERLARIRRFDQLVAYLRDELGWPIDSDDFEKLTFDYTPEELGIDAKNAAKIKEIKRLRPLVTGQPWGIFFVKFEPKRLPVVALRRILSQVALKTRASANKPERQTWAADDLLFVSNYGEGEERRITFAHFSKPQDGHDLPTLKVLGWDNLDTPLHLDAVARELTTHLAWPDDDGDPDAWRERWRAAFTLRYGEVISTSKAALRAPGGTGPRHPRPHPDGAGHRDRVRAAHQAHEGVPDRTRPRPGRVPASPTCTPRPSPTACSRPASPTPRGARPTTSSPMCGRTHSCRS